MSRHYDRNDLSLEARAERRVRRKIGFFIHALVFACVNAGLFLVNQVTGGGAWHTFPLFGWGLGLAIHGLVTFVSLQGEGLRRQMLQDEIVRLGRQEQ
jgi:hypothetical protein